MTKPIFVNVRGCNGSGKTTLLRQLAKDPRCKIRTVMVSQEYKPKEGKKQPAGVFECTETGKLMIMHPAIPVTITPEGYAILGDYTPAAAGATTAGCDRIKTQEATKKALETIAELYDVSHIFFEGVVVSTIFQPWLEWSYEQGGMVWAFFDTPLDICLQRIQKRNGGKPIKEDQVAAKHETISRVKQKALDASETVIALDWISPMTSLRDWLRCFS